MGNSATKTLAAPDAVGPKPHRLTLTAKAATLMVLCGFLFLLWVVEAITWLVSLEFILAIYCACVAAVLLLGLLAAKLRRRPLLFVFILGLVVAIGFGIVGMAWWLIASVIKWDWNTEWLVIFVFNVFILLSEIVSVLLAYSLTRDLDSKRVVTLGSPDPDGGGGSSLAGTGGGENEFSFSQGGGSMVEMQSQPQSQAAPEWPATAAATSKATTYSPPQARQYAATPQPPMPAYPQQPYPQQQPQGMYSNARGLAAPSDRDDDMFFVPQSRPHYEHDIIGAPATLSTNGNADEFNPFQERF